ncbi:MAG: hypothetical protein RR565_03560 [Erysipelothrix sp.]
MKKLFFIITLIVSFTLANLAIYFSQVNFSNTLFRPTINADSFVYEVSLLNSDSASDVKNTVESLAKNNNVNISISISDLNSIKESTEVYWLVQDEEYIDNLRGVTPYLSIDQFNALKTPITNNLQTEGYKISYLSDIMDISFSPFTLFNKTNYNGEMYVYGKSESNIQKFLLDLNSSGLEVAVIENVEVYQQSKLESLLNLILFKNPLFFISIALYFIGLFYLLYVDRRNSKILYINGISKLEYSSKFLRSKIPMIFGTIAIASIWLAYKTYKNIDLLFLSFLEYLKMSTLILVFTYLFVLLVTYSFRDIRIDSYVNGVNTKRKPTVILGLFKIIVISLSITVLVPLVDGIVKTNKLNERLQESASKYEGIYRLNENGNFGNLLVDREENILNLIENDPRVLYVSNNYSEAHVNDDSTEYFNSVIYSNENFIVSQSLRTIDNQPIDKVEPNTIYVSPNMFQIASNKIKTTQHLCIETLNCDNIKIQETNQTDEVNLLSYDSYLDTSDYSTTYIIIPLTKIPEIANVYYSLSDNNDKEEMTDILSEVLPKEEIRFTAVSDYFKNEVDINNDVIRQKLVFFTSYLFINMLVSMLYYISVVDIHKKEIAIYWVNGVNKFKYLYEELGVQIILNAICMLFLKLFLQIYASLNTLILVFIILCLLDVLSVTIYKKAVINDLKRYVKERE